MYRGDIVSVDIINNNSEYLENWIERVKKLEKEYYEKKPDSLIPLFEQELRELGFEFEISNQTLAFMPKYKDIILPIVIRYYIQARDQLKYDEQKHFMKFFYFKGFEEVVPILLDDFYSGDPYVDRWSIADCMYQICSKKYIDDYLKIISNPKYGQSRQMLILLLGKLKIEDAIPIIIALLEDEGVRLHAICALGEYRREEFRPYFERFEDSKHTGWRKYAKAALKKLK